MKSIKQWFTKARRRKWLTGRHLLAIVVIASCAWGGAYYIFSSYADTASSFGTVEAEDGTASGGASKQSDQSASGGAYVLFGSSSQTSAIYPSQVLDLTDWKITMPYDENGEMFEPDQTPGDAVEITQPRLATFSDPNYFYVDQAHDGVVFEAPVNGATTSGSGYPRSELREMASSDGSDEASWNMDSSAINSETVTEAANHLPQIKPQVVIAQIHDSSHDIIEILADATNSHGSDYTSDEPADCSGSGGDIDNPGCQFDICYRYDGNEQDKCLVDDYTIGTQYTLTMSAQNSIITMVATYDGKTTTITQTDTSSDDATGNYFKAGCYTQSNVSTEGNYTDYGQSEIYDISDVYNP